MSRLVLCPVCKRKVHAHHDGIAVQRIQKHWAVKGDWKGPVCSGSGRTI